MSKPKIFIDGQEGTTGLQILDRLERRTDIELLTIAPERRKEEAERTRLMDEADLVFFCLPDDAARAAAELACNGHTKIIDASTAHRVCTGWVYGLPELHGHRMAVAQATRVANPGCHATGFLTIATPLTRLGILPMDYPLTCFSITGYSGGGKKMIAEYETNKDEALFSPRVYGTNLRHKHLPEMQAIAGLEQPPVFCPVVDDFYMGMSTTLMFHNRYLTGQPTAEEIQLILSAYYAGEKVVTVAPFQEASAFLASNAFAGTDRLELTVSGNHRQTIVTARFDNLGKGASGAAVQNMNLMLGFEETEGLRLP